MSYPRRVVPGACYLLTRRAYQRTNRMRPHAVTNQISEYCAAWAAAKTGVVIHAVVVMSNHHHLVVSDPDGVLPEFLRELHRTMAKALNASQGQWENLWSAEAASAVRLPTMRDVLDKIAYCAANPVAAALVKTPEEWPGVNAWVPGTRKEVGRPTAYFDASGEMPKQVQLRIEAPAGLGNLDDWRGRVTEAVAAKVRGARASVAQQGLAFLGPRVVMKQSFLTRATKHELKRRINPVLAAKDVWIRQTFLRLEKAFRAAHRSAVRAWKAGERCAVFPFGTWWMRVHHGAGVMPAAA